MDESPELESRLKEILYRCLEEIQSTKAALYLREDDGTFRVSTQYGFRKGLREQVPADAEIVDTLLVRRAPFMINSLAEDMRYSEFLYEADTSRLLVAPIYSRGKLAAFIDLRDKSGNRDFDSGDLTRVTSIADEFLQVFADEEMYGQRKIKVGEAPAAQRVLQNRFGPQSPAIIDRADGEIARGVLQPKSASSEEVEAKLGAAAGALPMFLGLRSIAVAAISVLSDTGGRQILVAKGEIPPDALEQFHGRLRVWLQRRGEETGDLRSEVQYPFGTREYRVTPERIKSLLAAPVRAAEPHTMILSVVFDQKPDDETRNQLERLHKVLDEVVANGFAATRLSEMREKVALRLLEPDLEVFPDLALHCRKVATHAVELGRKIGMSAYELEQLRLGALVHDVGLRLVGFQRSQRKGRLSEEEMQIVRKHPVVGAAVVADSALGTEIARLVYSHHERIDGTGYPEGIQGSAIPLGSRIIHICEAFDAMTSEHSYKERVGPGEAIRRLREEAGTQFDADLIESFCSLIENS